MHFAKDKEQPVKHKERQKTWFIKLSYLFVGEMNKYI